MGFSKLLLNTSVTLLFSSLASHEKCTLFLRPCSQANTGTSAGTSEVLFSYRKCRVSFFNIQKANQHTLKNILPPKQGSNLQTYLDWGRWLCFSFSVCGRKGTGVGFRKFPQPNDRAGCVLGGSNLIKKSCFAQKRLANDRFSCHKL